MRGYNLLNRNNFVTLRKLYMPITMKDIIGRKEKLLSYKIL
jgi:hypothetical protein